MGRLFTVSAWGGSGTGEGVNFPVGIWVGGWMGTSLGVHLSGRGLSATCGSCLGDCTCKGGPVHVPHPVNKITDRGVTGQGGVPAQVLPPVNIMTYRCKNTTLAQKSFVRSNNQHCDVFYEDLRFITGSEASILFTEK